MYAAPKLTLQMLREGEDLKNVDFLDFWLLSNPSGRTRPGIPSSGNKKETKTLLENLPRLQEGRRPETRNRTCKRYCYARISVQFWDTKFSTGHQWPANSTQQQNNKQQFLNKIP